jgi:hypothetical protein
MTTERLRRLLEKGPASLPVRDLSGATEYEKREFLKVAKEVANRSCEALKLYTPLPFQEAFHACNAKETIIIKGNRAGGAQPLSEVVLGPSGWKTMGSLTVGEVVIGGDGNPCTVTAVYPQGILPVVRVTFDDGATTLCSEDHLWKCKTVHQCLRKTADWSVHSLAYIREWGGSEPKKHMRAIIPECAVKQSFTSVPLDPYLLGVLLGDGTFSCKAACFVTPDEDITREVIKVLPEHTKLKIRQDRGTCIDYRIVRQKGTARGNAVITALRELGLMGKKGSGKFIPELYIHNSVEVRLALLQGLMDTDGSINELGHCSYSTISPSIANGVAAIVRSLGGKARVKWRRYRKFGIDELAPNKLAFINIRLPHAQKFRLRRKAERQVPGRDTTHRILRKIEYVGEMECRCIKVDSPDNTYVTSDYIVTHNSLSGFAEDARACTRKDPYGKYPDTGTCVCLGFGEKHIGRVIHKFLFRAGAFSIIRDLVTREWRVFKPWAVDMGGDAGREKEAKPAPPLIPPRFIEDGGMVWDSRGDRVFSVCRLTTGWEIMALNSAGDPSQAQGFDVDLYHIDEDTANIGWYEEAVGRTAITKGKIRWTALPHSKNDDILNMVQRAEDEASTEHPMTVCIRASMFDNPYYPQESRDANLKIWAAQGEDVLRKRAYGELVLDSLMVYPTFSKYLHTTLSEDLEKDHAVRQALHANGGDPPAGWCLDMVVDPGHAVCAVVFFCTPPPSMGDFHIAYDELYLTKCDADTFGTEVAKKAQGRQFERFIIDAHGGRLTSSGSGISPQRQYEMQLQARGIKCNLTGCYFTNGSDDIKGREGCLREWLRIQDAGLPKFLVATQRCVNLVREIVRFKKKQQKIGSQLVTIDEANRRANTHATECVEYAAAHGLEYVKPNENVVTNTWVRRVLRDREMRERQRRTTSPSAGQRTISLAPRGTS